jgi:hypothetical protein
MKLILCIFFSLIAQLFARKKHRILNRSKCNVYKAAFTELEKQSVIDAHNNYRNQIALGTTSIGPKLDYASNMRQVFWSEEIAKKAQEWADGCKFKHSGKDFRKLSTMKLGENLYYSGSSKTYQEMDWAKAVKAWYEEIKNMETSYVNKFPKSPSKGVIGHFTQVIWAESYLVGCGFSQYSEPPLYKSFYVCQYGPAGNFINSPIYKASQSQSVSCPTGWGSNNPSYKGLCCPDNKCTSLRYDQ